MFRCTTKEKKKRFLDLGICFPFYVYYAENSFPNLIKICHGRHLQTREVQIILLPKFVGHFFFFLKNDRSMILCACVFFPWQWRNGWHSYCVDLPTKEITEGTKQTASRFSCIRPWNHSKFESPPDACFIYQINESGRGRMWICYSFSFFIIVICKVLLAASTHTSSSMH